MQKSATKTRDRLIETAATLFRQKGYHGTGLTEVLTASHAPKGSLYHHFPDGKSDLAMAAASWVSQGMLQIIDDSFAQADSFADGATTFCFKLAKLFDTADHWRSCPISTMLFDGQDNDAFRRHADRILTSWSECAAEHGQRLGLPSPQAEAAAELLLMTIQGAWTIARAKNSADVIRRIPIHLYG
ncbi:TetR/AcrR family transcriptional regulator [Profundibacter amoris]|uniref:TetR/AcrR family transcriptional regulator n=1 Tax=Profundibacter amoris TaxID=2171755 RepID=A0A347UJF6_9RHOB|nr:TetR/AcrR family transcriptional regulator [Profundibacter amoris]AXX98984.1 TetR/AcrR family transcriptional regulator [Profundibacter amoris]